MLSKRYDFSGQLQLVYPLSLRYYDGWEYELVENKLVKWNSIKFCKTWMNSLGPFPFGAAFAIVPVGRLLQSFDELRGGIRWLLIRSVRVLHLLFVVVSNILKHVASKYGQFYSFVKKFRPKCGRSSGASTALVITTVVIRTPLIMWFLIIKWH